MNAGRIARVYQWVEYAAFGRSLELARFHFLSRAAQGRRVLILGEGDGRFLGRLLETNRQARIAVVEMSGRMIALARERTPIEERSRVEFHKMDAASQPLPRGPFDLVVSHFFFDILSSGDASAVISKASALLAPGAVWQISEFQEPARGPRRLHARLWLLAMYRFFAISTGLRVSRLPPYRKMLESHGLTEIEHHESRFGLIRSQVWRKA